MSAVPGAAHGDETSLWAPPAPPAFGQHKHFYSWLRVPALESDPS